jgi:hypothetical protein
MSPRPFDPSELDQPAPDLDRAVSELESYVATTATDAPRGFEDRVMAAVEREPAPRRSFLAWLLVPPASGGGLGRFARAGALAATLVLAVAGALFAGQLADLVRHVGTGGSPTPSVSPSQLESVAPTLSTSPGLTSSPSPDASQSASETPGPSRTAGASEQETPEPTAIETPKASKTPQPSPTITPSPSPTPTPTS